jgi:hypothetical protein
VHLHAGDPEEVGNGVPAGRHGEDDRECNEQNDRAGG